MIMWDQIENYDLDTSVSCNKYNPLLKSHIHTTSNINQNSNLPDQISFALHLQFSFET